MIINYKWHARVTLPRYPCRLPSVPIARNLSNAVNVTSKRPLAWSIDIIYSADVCATVRQAVKLFKLHEACCQYTRTRVASFDLESSHGPTQVPVVRHVFAQVLWPIICYGFRYQLCSGHDAISGFRRTENARTALVLRHLKV